MECCSRYRGIECDGELGRIIRQPVTATELRKWPLMHGTLAYGKELEDIKSNGLIAGRISNSNVYDEMLGRKEFVFLAPATFRLQYGLGDPLVPFFFVW